MTMTKQILSSVFALAFVAGASNAQQLAGSLAERSAGAQNPIYLTIYNQLANSLAERSQIETERLAANAPQTGLAGRSGKEQARLAARKKGNEVVNGMAEKAREAAATAPALASINISCATSIVVSNVAYGALQTLCDVNDDGVADFAGTFLHFPVDFATAMTSFKGGLYVLTSAGNVNIYTDVNSRGLADASFTQIATGLAGSTRILPVSPTQVMTQDAYHGQLWNYAVLGNKSVTSQGINLTKLGFTAHSSQLVGNLVYSFDENTDTVNFTPVNGSAPPKPWFKGNSITAISQDELGNTFVQEAGNCGYQTDEPCVPPQIQMVLPNGSFGTLPPSPLLNIYNSSENVMYASSGNLYVVVWTPQGPDGSSTQQIIQYKYKVTGSTVALRPPTVFASAKELGGYPSINAITAYTGGPLQ